MKPRTINAWIGLAIWAAMLPSAGATIPSNQEYGVFSQCHACGILAETPTALSMIQSAISLYNQTVASGDNIPLEVGDMVQLESWAGRTGSYTITDRFFEIMRLPVGGWSDLVDLGTNHDSESYVETPPHGDPWGFVANYWVNGGEVWAYWGDLPWINGGP